MERRRLSSVAPISVQTARPQSIVVSVHYRKQEFTASHNNTLVAYLWLLENAQTWDG